MEIALRAVHVVHAAGIESPQMYQKCKLAFDLEWTGGYTLENGSDKQLPMQR